MGAMASEITDVSIACLFVQAQIKENTKSVSLAFVRGIHHKRASNAENVSIWWRHHVCILDISWYIFSKELRKDAS